MKNITVAILLALATLPACLDAQGTEPAPTIEPPAPTGACTFPDAPALAATIHDGQATISESQWNAELEWRFALAGYANCVNKSTPAQ